MDMDAVPRATVGGRCTCVNNGTVAAATGLVSSDSLAGLAHYGSLALFKPRPYDTFKFQPTHKFALWIVDPSLRLQSPIYRDES